VQLIKDNGLEDSETASVFKNGLMVHVIRASGDKIVLMVKENPFIQMEILMKETG
jgi:hypothetical protein